MKQQFYITFFILFILLMGAACEAPNQKVIHGPDVIDIETFLASQYDFLANSGSVQKTAIINDSVEIHSESYTAEEWKRELRFFSKSNINRKSWVDYFEIDTTDMEEGLEITYTTGRDNIPVKECIVRQDPEGNINYLSLFIHRSNPISALDRQLIYAFPDSIIIQNTEELWLVDDQNVKIIYSFQ